MKKTEPQQIGDVIRETLLKSNMDTRLRETQAAESWPHVVGEHIALQCGKPFCANGLLTVRIPSPTLRQELYMSRTILIRAINKVVGGEEPTVREIKFIG